MTTDDFLKQGIAALNAGRKAEAHNLLTQVVQQDERNEIAWLWLSGAVDTDEERRICLENVLAINPNNGVASRGLESLIAIEGVRPLSAISSPASEAEPLNSKPAMQPAVETRKDIGPQPSTGSQTPVPRAKAKGRRTNSGWKWLLVGSSGVVFLLLVGCFLAYVLGFIQLPSAMVPAGPLEAVAPLSTATPKLTPTPSLFFGRPRSYLPSQSEMPPGYRLEPGISGPMADVVGYQVLYYNPEHVWSTSGESFLVGFTANVFPSEEQARLLYNDIASPDELGQAFGAQSANLRSAHAEVPDVDESAAFVGSLTLRDAYGKTTVYVSVIIIRAKNLTAVITTQSFADTPAGLQEALYYVSLVTEKLNE